MTEEKTDYEHGSKDLEKEKEKIKTALKEVINKPKERKHKKNIKRVMEKEMEVIQEDKKITHLGGNDFEGKTVEAIEEKKSELIQEPKLGDAKYESKESRGEVNYMSSTYQPQKKGSSVTYGQPSMPEIVENQEFYVSDPSKCKDVLERCVQEFSEDFRRMREMGMPSIQESNFYEIEPETKKLKIRKMPKTVLDRLKEQLVLLDYYKNV